MNDSWEAMASLWLGSEPQRLWRLHSDRVNAALVKRWLPPVKSVLKTDLFDEAVSGGLYPVLAERAERVVGIDASQAIVEAARRRNPQLEAVRGDVRDLPLGNEELEAVVSNSTLDHFDSPVEIEVSLRELGRALQPGGLLILTLDNPINPAVALTKALPRARLNRMWSRVGESSARRGLVPYYVGATLGPRAFQAAVDRSGFEPLELITIVHFPRIAGVVAARLLEERASSSAHQRFLELLWRAERLGSWPTRLVTGHFLAIRARRRPAAPTGGRP